MENCTNDNTSISSDLPTSSLEKIHMSCQVSHQFKMENSTNDNTSISSDLPTSSLEKTFKKRPGTTDVGKDYENALMANIVLQKIFEENSKDFFVWSNDENFGAFDDVILQSDIKCAIQLKHVTANNRTLTLDALKADKGNFSIKKYFESFKEKEAFLSDFNLIILTNLKFNVVKNQELLLFDEEEFRVQIVEVDVDPVINTTKETQKCFKFEIKEENCPSKVKDYEKFFKKFFFYANQLNVAALEKNISKQIEEKFFCKDDVSRRYLDFFTKWNLVDGSKNKLDKAMMKRLLALYLVSANIRPISFGEISENRKILQSAMTKFHVTTFDQKCLQKIWVYCKTDLDEKKIKTTNKNYRITKFNLQEINSLTDEDCTKLLWLMDKCPLIVEEDAKVYHALNLCRDRRFVVLTNKKSTHLEKHSVFSKLSDLKRYSKNFDKLISNFKCQLSEKVISLKQIENKEIQDEITTNELLLMVDKAYKINRDVEDLPETYIRRHLTRNIINFKFLDNIDEDTVVFISNVKRVEELKERNAVDVKTYLEDKSSEQEIDSTSKVEMPKSHHSKISDGKSERIENVGGNSSLQHSIMDCYGPRQREELTKFNVKTNMHTDLSNLKKDFTASVKKQVKNKSSEQQIVFTNKIQNSHLLFQRICDNKSKKSYHHLNMFDRRLEWIKTVGDISSLKKYRVQDCSIREKSLVTTNVNNNVHLVVGDPGVGKSCFLKSIKNRFSSKSLVTIFSSHDMKKICNFIKTGEDNLDDFIMELKYPNWKKLDRCIVKLLTDKNEVIYLWDALDEIVEDEDRNTILEVVKKFSEKGIVQWMTCRRHLKDALETKFGVLSRTLLEFNESQQTEYLQERLKSVCRNDSAERKKLTNKILNNVVILKHKSILSIPLQLFMLTEICCQDKSRILDLEEGTFSLANLYEYFVEEKFNFNYKKNCLDDLVLDSFKQEKKTLIKDFENAALKAILEEDIFNELDVDIDEDLQGYGDKFGFVTEVIDNNSKSTIKFSHISYAEYFVASYLARQKTDKRGIIKRVIFEKKYENVRFFLDLILAKNCPAHIAVLYNNLEKLRRCEKEIHIKDAWNRSPLHLVCSWGGKWKLLHIKKNADKFELPYYFSDNTETLLEYIQILDILISQCDINEPDKIMKMTAVAYGEMYNSIFALATIDKKHQTGNIHLTDTEKCNILFYSVKFNLKQFIPAFKSYINCILYGSSETLLHLVSKDGNEEMVKVLIENGSDVNALNTSNKTPFMLACQTGHTKIVEILMKTEVDINSSDKDGKTSLMIACESGNEKIVEILIKAGVGINTSDKDGKTPLIFACESRNEKIVEVLINAGVDINTSDKNGKTPFLFACESGNENIVEILIKAGVDINAYDKDKKTSLMFACRSGNGNIVDILMKPGVGINTSDKDGKTPLMFACESKNEKIVEVLINAGVGFNTSDKDGKTPLMFACESKNEKIVEVLINAGVGINTSDKDGKTPLMFACESGNEKIVEVLIKAGVDINAYDKDGRTAFTIAALYGQNEVITILIKAGANINVSHNDVKIGFMLGCELGHEKHVKTLIKAGFDINAANENGVTPLMCGCRSENSVKILLKAGADINASDKNGINPIITACAISYVRVVEILIKAGADLNSSENNGQTALMVACHSGNGNIVEMLIEAGVNINASDKDGVTAFISACRSKNKTIVEILMKAGVDINASDNTGLTAFMIACESGDEEIVKTLLKVGVNIHAWNKEGVTAFMLACTSGNKNIVEILIKAGVDINATNNDGSTAFMFACESGNENIVKILMDFGADINAYNKNGATPLIVACGNGHKNIVEILMNAGVDINAFGETRITPLICACISGHETIVEMLINAGVDISVSCLNGWTPFMMACYSGEQNIVEILIKRGVDINASSKNGDTAFSMACEIGNKSIVEMLIKTGVEINTSDEDGYTPLMAVCKSGNKEIVEILIKSGVEINTSNQDGYTPLMLACKSGNEDIVDILIKSGVDINTVTKEGVTAFMIACNSGKENTVKILIKAGVDINASTKDGTTAFIIACEYGNAKMVQMLVKAGVDITASDKEGWTPLMCACEKGKEETVKILIQAGVDINTFNKRGVTALISACYSGNEQLIEDLIKAGADINASNIYGLTPLMCASILGRKNVVEILIKAGVNRNDFNKFDFMAFVLNVIQNRSVETLVQIILKPNIKNYLFLMECFKIFVFALKVWKKYGKKAN